jgi:hypothetical protein
VHSDLKEFDMKIKYLLALALGLQFIAPVTGVTPLSAGSAFAGDTGGGPPEDGIGPGGPIGGGGPAPDTDADTCTNGCGDPPGTVNDDADATQNGAAVTTLAAQGAATGCGPAPTTCNNGN